MIVRNFILRVHDFILVVRNFILRGQLQLYVMFTAVLLKKDNLIPQRTT
jgi:hypothetical protein